MPTRPGRPLAPDASRLAWCVMRIQRWIVLACATLWAGGCGTAGPGAGASGGSASDGTTSGGSASGGAASSGGLASSGGAGALPSAGGDSSGGIDGSGAAGTGSAGSGGAPASGGAEPGSGGQSDQPAPAATFIGEDRIALSGLTVVSYGGYLNGESFQQDAIVSFGGYQYAAFWNTNRSVVLARRTVPDTDGDLPGAWEKFDFTDHQLSADDAHNTISLGVSPADGVLHVAFDHHNSPLHYRRSVAGLLTDPENVSWSSGSFSETTSNLTGSGNVTLLTYPRFVTRPSGDRLLLSARLGESGSGDEYLWEYDATTQMWQEIGEYIDGTSDGINAYLHGLAYDSDGERLYAAWCWRESPDASTNFGLYFAYSDDHGRTFQSDAGAVVGQADQTPLTRDTAGLEVWDIPQERGLINQEHMIVDAEGRVHVLLSHMADTESNRADFTQARTVSEYFVYTRLGPGEWHRRALDQPSILNFRGKLASSSSSNVYAILPDLRIVGASPDDDFRSWSLLYPGESGRFFSDPLIDAARVAESDHLTVYYPAEASVDIWGIDFSLD